MLPLELDFLFCFVNIILFCFVNIVLLKIINNFCYENEKDDIKIIGAYLASGSRHNQRLYDLTKKINQIMQLMHVKIIGVQFAFSRTSNRKLTVDGFSSRKIIVFAFRSAPAPKGIACFTRSKECIYALDNVTHLTALANYYETLDGCYCRVYRI